MPNAAAIAPLLEFALSRRYRRLTARIGMDLTMRFHQMMALAASRFDLVVGGAQGEHRLRDFAICTSAERLLRKIRRPVLVVKRRPAGAYRQVLAPVDFSRDAGAELEDLLLGSVTLHTLASADCDVLVVPAKARAARARR